MGMFTFGIYYSSKYTRSILFFHGKILRIKCYLDSFFA
jgi:hypothetical protein